MNWRRARVVVTGGAGFVGSHLCEALVARDARIIVVDDFSYSSPDNLKSISGSIEILEHRLGESPNGIQEQLEGDVLFHLAAMANPRECKRNFDSAFKSNVLGLKASLENGNRFNRIVYMSSASVYGDPDYVPIDESHPLKGTDPYAVTKILGEGLCKHYMNNQGLPITTIRNFNTFGPRQSQAYFVPTLIARALFEKKIEIWNAAPIRDFMFISDTVEALLMIAATDGAKGRTINLGRGEGIKVGKLAEMIAHMLRVPLVSLKKNVIGSAELVCDNSSLKALTGFVPRVSLEEGLRMTIDYFRTSCGQLPVCPPEASAGNPTPAEYGQEKK